MKYLIGCILIFIITSTTFSQTVQDYGIKIGYVNSNQTYTYQNVNDILKSKSGFSISAFIDLFNFSGFYISPEIKYIQKGSGYEMTFTGPDGPEPIDKKMMYVYHNYISIPISFSYKLPLNIGSPFIKIAPRYDIRINSHDDFNSPSSTYENYKNVFGGTLSLGFVPKLNFLFNPFIEFSYNMDFTNSYSNPNNSIKNNAFEVNVGIMFK